MSDSGSWFGGSWFNDDKSVGSPSPSSNREGRRPHVNEFSRRPLPYMPHDDDRYDDQFDDYKQDDDREGGHLPHRLSRRYDSLPLPSPRQQPRQQYRQETSSLMSPPANKHIRSISNESPSMDSTRKNINSNGNNNSSSIISNPNGSIGIRYSSDNLNKKDEGTLPLACQLATKGELSGHLLKLGENVRKWKRRFFVLRPTRYLYYYLSSGDVEPAGIIDLDLYTSCCEVKPEEFDTSNNEHLVKSYHGREGLDVSNYRNGTGGSDEVYRLKIPLVQPHGDAGSNNSLLRNVKGWSKSSSRDGKYVQFNSRQQDKSRQQKQQQREIDLSHSMFALKLVRPDNGDEIVLHASSQEELESWKFALSPSQRYCNLISKIEKLEAEKEEARKEIRRIDDELQTARLDSHAVRKRYEDENKFRRSLVEKLIGGLGSQLEDIIDEYKGELGVTAASEKEETNSPEKPTEELSYFDMFFNTVKSSANISNDNQSDEGTAFGVSGVDGSSAKVEEGEIATPSWEDMEFYQADVERRDDAVLVERLISYGAKVSQCMKGAKQEVARGAQEVKMLRLKLGNLAQKLHALEMRKTKDEEEIKQVKESNRRLYKEKKALIREVKKLRSDEASARAAAQASAQSHATLKQQLFIAKNDKTLSKSQQQSLSLVGKGLSHSDFDEFRDSDATTDIDTDIENIGNEDMLSSQHISRHQRQRENDSLSDDEGEGVVIDDISCMPETSLKELKRSASELGSKMTLLDANKATSTSSFLEGKSVGPIYDAREFRRELRMAISKAVKMAKPEDSIRYSNSMQDIQLMNQQQQSTTTTTSTSSFADLFLPRSNESKSYSQEKTDGASRELIGPQRDSKAGESHVEKRRDASNSSTYEEEEESYFGSFLASSMLETLGFTSNQDDEDQNDNDKKSQSYQENEKLDRHAVMSSNKTLSQSHHHSQSSHTPRLRHEYGKFAYRVVYPGGVWVRPSPDLDIPYQAGYEVIRKDSYFVSLERRVDIDNHFVYVRVGGYSYYDNHEEDIEHNAYEEDFIDESIIGWVFEKSLTKGAVILERDSTLQQLHHVIEPTEVEQAKESVNSNAKEREEEEEEEGGGEEEAVTCDIPVGLDSASYSSDTEVESSSGTRYDQGDNSISAEEHSEEKGYEKGQQIEDSSEGIQEQSASQLIPGTNTNMPLPPPPSPPPLDSDSGMTTHWPENSWEVVFHSQKIGVEFSRKGNPPRIVISRASGLVTFGARPQKMPTVGAILVGCNGIDVQEMNWKDAAKCLKDATSRPLKLRFIEPVSEND